MINVEKKTHLSLLAIHGWSAVILGLFLYVVIITGTIAVFADEISGWARPGSGEQKVLMPKGLGAAVSALAANVPPENLEEVSLFPSSANRLRVFFHGHHEETQASNAEQHEDEKDILIVLDTSTLGVIQRLEGEGRKLFASVKSDALADFLVDLHVRLLLPNRWGLLLTGLLGFAMMAAVVSGFIMHRHLIAELFTLRSKGNPVLQVRDKHVVASSWNLPFAFLLAFTGAFFSFGGAIGLPALAYVAFGGDTELAEEALLAPITLDDDRPAPLVDLDGVIEDARQRAKAEPNSLQVKHWGRADAHIQILFDPAAKQLVSSIFNYSGTSGEFLGSQPRIGREPSLGGSMAGLMDPLHFGDFAGLISKAVWFAMGCATAYVTLSGLLLWSRRREETKGGKYFNAASQWIGYGLPASLLAVGCGYFMLVDAVSAEQIRSTLSYVFFGSLLCCLLPAIFIPRHIKPALLFGCSGLLVALPLSRFIFTQVGWFSTASNQPLLISGDTLSVIAAAACLLSARKALTLAHDKTFPQNAAELSS